MTDYYNADNVYCCTYQEEISGYMAGYAAVKLGYKHLGFLGGMSVPAVTRFGYGYVQGVDEAAKSLESQVTLSLSMYAADSSTAMQTSQLTWIPGTEARALKLYSHAAVESTHLQQKQQQRLTAR